MSTRNVGVARLTAALLAALMAASACYSSTPTAHSGAAPTKASAGAATPGALSGATDTGLAPGLTTSPTPRASPSGAPVATPSATPHATETHQPPPSPTDSPPQTPGGMTREVLGFFLPSQIDYVLTTSDLSVLTTIAYFGISASKKGGLHTTVRGGATDWRWNAWLGSKMTQLINKAHNAGTKVVLTVTRFGWNQAGYNTTVRMLSSAKARARLARETADAVVDRGVDGVNVDFEPIPASQKQNFVDFVRRLRSALDARRHGLELTVATTGFIANYDVAGLTAPDAADAIFIMAYHYTGSWSTRAGAVSPLHRGSYDVTDTVNAFLELTTPDKIMLGLPYYGNVWSTLSSKLNAKTRPGSSTYGYPGSVVYANAMAIAAAHGRLWDDIEKVPWTRWQTRMCGSCPLTWRQLYYEDAQSLRLKHQLVLANGLRGTGIWTLGFGGSGNELNQELRSLFGSH